MEKGIIKGLISVLKMREARILAVSLEGLENVLSAGRDHYGSVSYIFLLTFYSSELRTSLQLN